MNRVLLHLTMVTLCMITTTLSAQSDDNMNMNMSIDTDGEQMNMNMSIDADGEQMNMNISIDGAGDEDGFERDDWGESDMEARPAGTTRGCQRPVCPAGPLRTCTLDSYTTAMLKNNFQKQSILTPQK